MNFCSRHGLRELLEALWFPSFSSHEAEAANSFEVFEEWWSMLNFSELLTNSLKALSANNFINFDEIKHQSVRACGAAFHFQACSLTTLGPRELFALIYERLLEKVCCSPRNFFLLEFHHRVHDEIIHNLLATLPPSSFNGEFFVWKNFEKWTLNSSQMTSPEKRSARGAREKLCIINFRTIIYQVSRASG